MGRCNTRYILLLLLLLYTLRRIRFSFSPHSHSLSLFLSLLLTLSHFLTLSNVQRPRTNTPVCIQCGSTGRLPPLPQNFRVSTVVLPSNRNDTYDVSMDLHLKRYGKEPKSLETIRRYIIYPFVVDFWLGYHNINTSTLAGTAWNVLLFRIQRITLFW